jgi:hypothetical protein
MGIKKIRIFYTVKKLPMLNPPSQKIAKRQITNHIESYKSQVSTSLFSKVKSSVA